MSKKKKALIIVFVLLIISAIVITVILVKNKIFLKKADPHLLESAGIDVNDPTYEGMEFYQYGNDIIIKGSHNNKSIQTEETNENQDMKLIPDEEKENYTITDVKVIGEKGQTIITGKITNKLEQEKNIILNIKFYSEDQKIKGATSEKVNVKSNETKDFTMKIQDDVSQYNYNLIAEYAN